jgi:penicillin-binding protein activator
MNYNHYFPRSSLRTVFLLMDLEIPMKNILCLIIVSSFWCVFCSGCEKKVRISDTPGNGSLYEDPGNTGTPKGIGIESQDIIAMTDKMTRDMLATPSITQHSTPPRIVIDASYFRNESFSHININLITDRLRVELNRAAEGRVVFLSRHLADMTENEYKLEENGVVTEGTQGETKQAFGYDYRLGGRIASLDTIDNQTNVKSRYYQITFELVERGSGVIVWNGISEIKKSALDNISYR